MDTHLEALLANLDDRQREVATHVNGPVCVRAGAGTGKTRAITHRLAYGIMSGVYDPRHAMALTFTVRAASEMRGRMRTFGIPAPQVRTFHSAALSQLQYFWQDAVGGPMPRVQENTFSYVAEAVGRLGLGSDRDLIRDVKSEIDWAKVSLISSHDYVKRAEEAGRSEDIASCSVYDIARLIDVYEDIKNDSGVLDFNDILLLLVGILLDNRDIASHVRHQYRYFTVDEYQDVSPLQHRLLQLWLGNSKELCVVGDVSQTIYSFAGASSSFLENFSREFPEASVIELVNDYRSTPQIVEVANKVIAAGRLRGAVMLESQRPASFPVEYKEYPTASDQSKEIAARIRELEHQGVPLKDIAILYRANSQSQDFEKALTEAGIPYDVSGNGRFFARKEVREALVVLRDAARSGSHGSLVSDVENIVRRLGWTEKVPERAGAIRERWDALNTLRDIAVEMSGESDVSLIDYVRELEKRAEDDYHVNTDKVTLSSIHAAKGLEWGVVFLVSMNEGVIPISYADSRVELEEERRLVYVALTRAKDRLFVSSYERYGERRSRPSRFLKDFLDDVGGNKTTQRVSRSTEYRQRSRAQKDSFAVEHPESLALFDALSQWRRAKAEEEKKAPYMIFHDSVLRSIAIARPRTSHELSAVKGVGSVKLEAWGQEILALTCAE